jgi:hypothetical protein
VFELLVEIATTTITTATVAVQVPNYITTVVTAHKQSTATIDDINDDGN